MESPIPPKTVRVSKLRTSPLWKVFKRISPGIAKCCICKRVLSFKSSNTNLKRHLSSKHRTAFERHMGQYNTKHNKGSETDPSIVNLIELVQRHPCIWDTRCDSYGDVQQQHDAWNAIASELYPDEEQSEVVTKISEQFNALRNGYFSNHRRSGYSKELSFMAPLTEDGYEEIPLDSAVTKVEISSEDELYTRSESQRKSQTSELAENEDIDEDWNQSKLQASEKEHDLQTDTKNFTGNQTACNIQLINADEDNLFLLSLASEMKKVPDAVELDFKVEFLAEFRNLLKQYLVNVE